MDLGMVEGQRWNRKRELGWEKRESLGRERGKGFGEGKSYVGENELGWERESQDWEGGKGF